MLQDKKQTDNQNQNILQKIQNAILASAAKWWMPLCHSDCWCSATHPLMNSIVPLTNQVLLFAGVTNTANMSQWEAVVTVSLCFQHLHPHTINPTASTHRHFVLSSVLLISRDQLKITVHWTRRSATTISWKIGDCEQSSLLYCIIVFHERCS